MKKKTLLREAFREIRHSSSRFLSILAIVAIGCGFFSGVKAGCPDMKLTAQTYFDEQNLADIHLLSTWGFDEDDLAAVSGTEDVAVAEGSYSADLLANSAGGEEQVIKVIGYSPDNTLNLPLLHEGRLPEASGECVIGSSSMDENGQWQIGDTITVRTDGEDDLSDTLSADTFTVVGVVQLPQYFSFSYGTTTISDGTLDGFILIPEGDFTLDVYTDIYLTLGSTEGLDPFESEYESIVSDAADRLETVADARTETRYNDTVSEAEADIADAEAEIADGRQKLQDAEAELSDARTELDDGWAEYNDGVAQAEQEFADAEAEIADGEAQLRDGEAAWQQNYNDYQTALQQLEDSRAQLDQYQQQAEELETTLSESAAAIESGNQLIQGLQNIQSAYADVTLSDISEADEATQGVISASSALDESLPQLLAGYITSRGSEKAAYNESLSGVIANAETTMAENEAQYQQGTESLQQLQSALESGEAEYEAGRQQLADAEAQLNEGRRTLDNSQAELQSARQELSDARAETDAELQDALQELNDGEAEYEDGLSEYETEKADAEADIADAEAQIADARQELSDLEQPEWYVLDRSSFPGVSTISDDADKVDAIAAVFPVFFVLVAALVCLTTMTRMVEEERTQIGTLKALGFSRGAVMFKFLLYAILASIIGSVAGCILGLKLLPYVIISCYSAMYQVPFILAPIRWGYVLGCLLVSVLCTSAVTVITCYGVMDTAPAQLMRPKAPKKGKRILLERFTFFWKRLSFSGKVTCRNLFRYKSRLLMTVIGVAGCTALMLTGFGLRYAISSISTLQYGEIFTYGGSLSLSDNLTAEEAAAAEEEILGVEGIPGAEGLFMRTVDAEAGGNTVSEVNLYVPADPGNLDPFIKLRDSGSGETLTLSDGGCIITEKLSRLLNIGVGDTIRLGSEGGDMAEVTVTGVAEGYVLHYVYLTAADYEALFGEEAVPTSVLYTTAEGADEGSVNSALLKLPDVQGVVDMSFYSDAFDDLVASLNMIVWVLIGAAAALAVIVLYNLSNINVSERVRELATIKVLGFYDREVTGYICRENTIAALLGMAAGLVLGIWFEDFVVSTAEVDVVMFVHGIPASSFILSAVLTFIFIMLVNGIVHFSLKKIDMVESLKSVE